MNIPCGGLMDRHSDRFQQHQERDRRLGGPVVCEVDRLDTHQRRMRTTPWAMLCAVLSAASVVRSSIATTVVFSAGKVMLESQQLAAIAKRPLGKQPYLRQTVENDTLGSNLIHCIEDELDGFAKLKIGRIQQTSGAGRHSQRFRVAATRKSRFSCFETKPRPEGSSEGHTPREPEALPACSAAKVRRMLRIWRFARNVVNGWLEAYAFSLAATLAYYAIFSIAPLLLLSIVIASFVVDRTAAVERLTGELISLIGPTGSDAIKQMLDAAGTAQTESWAGIMGLLVLLFAATGFVGSLQNALDRIWKSPPAPSGIWAFFRSKLFSFSLILAAAFLLLVSLVLSTAMTALAGKATASLGLSETVVAVIIAAANFMLAALSLRPSSNMSRTRS